MRHDGPVAIPRELRDIFMKTVFSGLTEEEAVVAYRLARRRNLDIEAKQIFFVPYTDKQGRRTVVSQTSIDGLRLIAAKTGKYGGSIKPQLTIKDKDGKKLVIDHEEYDPSETERIVSATVSVINTDFPQPQKATALYSSYVKSYDGRPTGLWASMPDVMLLKCAESMALRKAFPQDLSGIYTSEEMDQARNASLIINNAIPKPSLKNFRPKNARPEPHLTENEPATKNTAIDVAVVRTEVLDKPAPDSQPPAETPQAADHPDPVQKETPADAHPLASSRKKQTIQQLLASIPDGLRKMNPNIDTDLFDYCKAICLDFLGVDKVSDAPEERIEELRTFMRTTMIDRLKEYNYL